MKKKSIKTKKQAVSYLQGVLKNWEEFFATHQPFEQALRIVLKEELNRESK